MNIIRILKQIYQDHRAMNMVRAGNGDISLVAISTNTGIVFQCEAWQHDTLKMDDRDPAMAIIKACEFVRFVKGRM